MTAVDATTDSNTPTPRAAAMVSVLAQRMQVGTLIFSLPHVATLGCDREPGSEVSVRAAKSIELSEPIPGGGVCHGCITDWEIVTPDADKDERWLRLCVNTRAKYTGSSVLENDDLPLDDLLTSAESKWELLAKGSDLCKDGCVGVPESDDPESDYKVIRVELDPVDKPTPDIIRFHDGGGPGLDPGENLPSVAFPRQGLTFQCPAKPASVVANAAIDKPLPADPVRTAMAHITHPSPSGGVRSCSGFLVSARHVLTADHCFDASNDTSTIEIRLGDTSVPLGVSAIHPYDPDIDGIADLDLALLELEVPVKTHPLKIAHPATSALGGLYGYGYGVMDPLTLGADHSYDWAQLKRVALEVTSRPSALPPQGPNTLYLKAQMGGSVGLCRGDSGGPVIRGDGRVVAVSFGRVVKAGPGGLYDNAQIEPTMRAFAFSRGNFCGDTPLLAYAAAHIDAGVYQWLNAIAGPLSPFDLPIDLPLPFPQEATE